jgi:predicted dehydrogenase
MSYQGAELAGPERYERPLLFGRTAVGANEFGFFSFPVRDFVRAVIEGHDSPMPLAEGLKNVKIVAAAVESAESGRVVEVDL